MKTTSPGLRSPSSVEMLETRIAPAGVVTVNFANGLLILEGDASGNEVEIRPGGPDGFLIVGVNGTTLNGGSTTELAFDGPLKGISADLLGGNDLLSFLGIDVAGNVSVLLGEGTNGVTFDDAAIKGNATITGGTAADTVTFAEGATSVGGNFTVDLGAGADQVLATGAGSAERSACWAEPATTPSP